MKKNILIMIIAFSLLGSIIFIIKKKENERKIKKILIELDSLEKVKEKFLVDYVNYCNEEAVLHNFKSWLEFNYPDWKIVNDFEVKEINNCEYNIKFTAIDPHFLKYGMKEKELIIFNYKYSDDFQSYSLTRIRGVIY